MSKKFTIVMTYENKYDPNLTEEQVKEWISHLLALNHWKSIKIEEIKEQK